MATKVTKLLKVTAKASEVGKFMAALEHPLKAEINALRQIIKAADKRIQEGIKWNAPSFYLKEHFATLKLRPTETVQVVLHTGAKVKSNRQAMKITDPAGLIKWAAKDRGVVTFSSLKDIQSQQAAFTKILKQWIKQLYPTLTASPSPPASFPPQSLSPQTSPAHHHTAPHAHGC